MADRNSTFGSVLTGGLGKLTGVLLISAALSACSASNLVRPVVSKHGYIPEQEKVDSLKTGVSSKNSVQEVLGTPSSITAFGADTWYYISSKQQSFAFFETKTKERNILALSFDTTGKLENVERYDISDGKVINYVGRETPTRGRTLTFLEQMFGNVGRGLPGGVPGQQQGQNRSPGRR